MYDSEDYEDEPDDDDYEPEEGEYEPHQPSTGLYSRQNLLGSNLRVPHTVTVIGCGGVGSYVAIFMALLGAQNISLVDHDIVEESNRNRVLFRYYDVSDHKVNAIANIIMSIRPDIRVFTHPCKIEDVPEDERTIISRSDHVFDCRDIVDVLPTWVPRCKITGGYDGKRVTMHINPDLSRIFSVGSMTYTTTPSYCVPPALIGVLIALYSSSPTLEERNEKIVSFDVDNMFTELMEHDRI